MTAYRYLSLTALPLIQSYSLGARRAKPGRIALEVLASLVSELAVPSQIFALIH